MHTDKNIDFLRNINKDLPPYAFTNNLQLSFNLTLDPVWVVAQK